jgi:hypothetical protein
MVLGEFLEALLPITDRLSALSIAHYIGGSFASSTYGAVRATNDVDIATDLRQIQVPAFLRGLESTYYLDEDAAAEATSSHRSFNLVHLATAIKIDIFCPVPTPFQLEAFRRAKPHALDPRRPEQTFMLATPEDVILTKLCWYDLGGRVAEMQLRDIVGIIRVQKTLDIGYLRRWAPTLGIADTLERLIPS